MCKHAEISVIFPSLPKIVIFPSLICRQKVQNMPNMTIIPCPCLHAKSAKHAKYDHLPSPLFARKKCKTCQILPSSLALVCTQKVQNMPNISIFPCPCLHTKSAKHAKYDHLPSPLFARKKCKT